MLYCLKYIYVPCSTKPNTHDCLSTPKVTFLTDTLGYQINGSTLLVGNQTFFPWTLSLTYHGWCRSFFGGKGGIIQAITITLFMTRSTWPKQTCLCFPPSLLTTLRTLGIINRQFLYFHSTTRDPPTFNLVM